MSANINIGASRVLWPGVLDAAERGDANLISYPGGRLNSSENFEGQRNVIFDLINTEHLDGLVCWTSALAGVGTVTPQEVVQFHQRFRALPLVSLAAQIDNCPMVAIDSYRGMQLLISHLVDVHQYHKIALIRGPEGHPYALERHQAFMDTLEDKGIPSDASLISPTANWEAGAHAMQILLDDRKLRPGIDFQAVVAASDLLAIDALKVLVERGIRVPVDVAVVGFNDIEEGRLVRPPLTSVSLPFYEQGQRALETLLSALHGETKRVPKKVNLESSLLIRQSCGCSSQSIAMAPIGLQVDELTDFFAVRPQAQSHLIEQIVSVISNRGVATTWAKLLIDAFYAEIKTRSSEAFLSVLDGMLKQGRLDSDNTIAWQTAISVLRQFLMPALEADEQMRAEDLFGQARIVISEAIQHAQSIRQVEYQRQNRLLRDLGQELITTFDMEKLGDVLSKRLPELGINCCYLALYEAEGDALEMARLILAYRDGASLILEEDGRSFPASQLVPPDLLPDRRYSFVVEPLFFQEEPIGYAVFEVGPRDGDIYEVLRDHISSAMKGGLLFQEVDQARMVAERANRVKSRLLANVSHELRTPLNIIIGNTQRLMGTEAPDLDNDLELIQHNAEHQLRIINDLLDLSRAEINALDLYPERLSPRPLLEEAFNAFAKDAATSETAWTLEVPNSLPEIECDPVRLRQVLLNLLSNAAKFTEAGQITLGAETAPPYLHLWVSDTGSGIPDEIVNKIYEPFFTYERGEYHKRGIGLGLSITKHLVNLHKGILTVDTHLQEGSVFHIYLPLLDEKNEPASLVQPAQSMLWLISRLEEVPAAVEDFSARRGLTIQKVNLDEDLDQLLAQGGPEIVAWDLTAGLVSEDWVLVRRMQNHPSLIETPFVLFQEELQEDATPGYTSLVVKPTSNQALWDIIQPALPQKPTGTILIVDDDERARQATYEVLRAGIPNYQVRTTEDGEEGLISMFADPPDLVILDLMMPRMDGFDVLDAMRADERTCNIPVVILSGRQLSLSDVQRLEKHAAVTLQSKGMLSSEEMLAAFHKTLFDGKGLPPHTSAIVKRSIAYLHQNYTHALSRFEIADKMGVNEDYLTRLFKEELGISPWDYLNRYRILQAKDLLHHTHYNIGQIGQKVGFSDASYFSRVFKRVTGMSPGDYRKRKSP